MQYRNVGSSDLRVSAVGMGCNNFVHRVDLAGARALVHKALDLGITLFDTADVYGNKGGSETFLGDILGPRRKDVVLATKFGQQMDEAGEMKGGSRRYIMKAIEASLKRLNTDYIDVYQQHWPYTDTPIEETLRALDDLVRQGKVRYAGGSNFTATQVRESHKTATHLGLKSYISYQAEYSLLARNPRSELIPALAASGAGLLPYYPLASGLLTGKYQQGTLPAGTRLATPRRPEMKFVTDADWPLIARLEAFCDARGHSLLDLAIGWLLAQPIVASVIAGVTQPEQLVQNVAAMNWSLTKADLAKLNDLFSEDHTL